jgi:molecular chaperone DnaK (HSP70)
MTTEISIDEENNNHQESIIDAYFNSVKSIKKEDIDNNPSDDDTDDESSEENTENKNDIEPIVGIDLGTTNSCVSIWRNKNLEIIPDEFGNRTIPSIVAFTNKTRYIGQDAKNQKELNPENVFYEVKRLIGRKIDDVSVTNDLELFTYKLEGDKENNILLASDIHNQKKFTPEEISAMILTKLKNMATDYLKQEITKAVITVPAYFNDAQRQATKDAASISGLECVRIINEPTAAALAYGLMNMSLHKKINKEAKDINVVVYDFGGGTLDTTLLTISDGIFEVLASSGNTHLGGVDFDNRLIRYCISQFKKKYNIKELTKQSLLSLQKLKKSCENAKKILSTTNKCNIAVREFYEDKDLFITITRDKFVEICKDLLILCIKPLEDVLKSCDMTKNQIDEIILVGGMTRMPTIRENIKNFFGKEPNCTVNPDEVVSAGAAIQGYILSHKEDPFSESITLLDIIPLSLGVDTIGGVMSTLIPRNTVIPVSKKKLYTTDTDYVDSVNIKIYEGERKMTKDNFFVGEFELKGINKAPRGVPEIQVKFSVDINGIITVSAEDLKNHNKNSITITGNKGRLKQDEIKKLLNEAKSFELKDKVERQKKQFYYEVDDLCSNIKVNIANNEFKLSDKDKKMIGDDIDKVIEWLTEKKYFEHQEDEMKNIIKRLKKRYGMMILKGNVSDDIVKANNVGNNNSTTVYGNEEDDDNVKVDFEKIENEEFGIDQLGENELAELKQMKNSLTELCYSVFDIISSDALKLLDEDKQNLRDFVDDTLLWVNIRQKPTKIDYKMKIDDLNNECNKVLEKYQNNNQEIFEYNQILQNIKSSKDELSQLCYAIKSSIINNLFSLHEKQIKSLDQKIDETLEWIMEVDIEACKNPENGDITKNEVLYKERLDEINELCDKLYQSMMGVSINSKIDILGNDISDNIITLNETGESGSGTSIADIMKKKVEKQ